MVSGLNIDIESGMDQPSKGRIVAGRFRLEEKLGRGGYGAVYRATQLSVDRDVALKLVHPHLEANEEVQQRFAREARLASRLRHPNIVRVIDFGDAEGELFLVMEFLPGPTLKARMRDSSLALADALEIGVGVARGLEAAHRAGLVHRDLKPSNVILVDTPEGERPVVIDFGLVKSLADRADDGLTRSNVLVGTPAYVSPEAVVGDRPDHRSDLYALGVLLYEMISGEKPVRGSTALETVTAHLRGEIVPLDRRCDVPAGVAECVHRLLARAPEERPEGAGLVAKQLQAELDALRRPPTADDLTSSQSMTPTVPSRFVGSLDATMVPQRGPGASSQRESSEASSDTARLVDLILPVPESPPMRDVPRSSARTGVAAAVVLAALVVGVVAFWRSDAPPEHAPTASMSALGARTASVAPQEAAPSAVPASAVSHAQGTLTAALNLASAEHAMWRRVAAIGDARGSIGHAVLAAVAVPVPSARPVGRPARSRPARAEREGDRSRVTTDVDERSARDDAGAEAAEEAADTGTASINVAPFGQVWIDGRAYGDAPVVGVMLSVGEHQVETRYADAARTERVVIRAGEHVSITHRFEIPP